MLEGLLECGGQLPIPVFIDQFPFKVDRGERIRLVRGIDGQQFHQRLFGDAEIIPGANERGPGILQFDLGAQHVEARDRPDVKP